MLVGGRIRVPRAQAPTGPGPPIAFVAVDLLLIDGDSLVNCRLLERKRLLNSALKADYLGRITPFVRTPVGSLARPGTPRVFVSWPTARQRPLSAWRWPRRTGSWCPSDPAERRPSPQTATRGFRPGLAARSGGVVGDRMLRVRCGLPFGTRSRDSAVPTSWSASRAIATRPRSATWFGLPRPAWSSTSRIFAPFW